MHYQLYRFIFITISQIVNHLVNIELFYDSIERRVEIIEHVDHLHRGATMTDRCETDNVTEEDGHPFVRLRLYVLFGDGKVNEIIIKKWTKAQLNSKQPIYVCHRCM